MLNRDAASARIEAAAKTSAKTASLAITVDVKLQFGRCYSNYEGDNQTPLLRTADSDGEGPQGTRRVQEVSTASYPNGYLADNAGE